MRVTFRSIQISDAEAEGFVAEFDVDNTGQIEVDEFVELMFK